MKKSKIRAFIEEYIYVVCQKFKTKVDFFERDKFKAYYLMLCEWMELRNRNICLAEYLKRENFHNIAIYGKGKLGCLIIDELNEDKEIHVKYILDKNKTSDYKGIQTISITDADYSLVDVILITPIFEYLDIAPNILEYGTVKLISIEDIVHELYRTNK